jgi:hypothetical protein
MPQISGKKSKGMIQSLISRLLLWLTALSAGVGLIFLILAVKRSTLPYNSEGNYFDGIVNYHEQSIAVYAVLAGGSFLAAIMLFAIRRLAQRSQ